MKKKIVLLIISGLMTVALFGCASKQDSSNQANQKIEESENTQQEDNSANEENDSTSDDDSDLDIDKQFEKFMQERPNYREFGAGYGDKIKEDEVRARRLEYICFPKEMVDEDYHGWPVETSHEVSLYYNGPYNYPSSIKGEDGWEVIIDSIDDLEFAKLTSTYNSSDEGLNNQSKIIESISEHMLYNSEIEFYNSYYFEENPINQRQILDTGKFVDACGIQYFYEQKQTAQGIKYAKYSMIVDDITIDDNNIGKNKIYYIFDNPYGIILSFKITNKNVMRTWGLGDDDIQYCYDEIDDCVINNSFFATDMSAFDSYMNNDEAVLKNIREAVSEYVSDYYHDNYYFSGYYMLVEEKDKFSEEDGELLFWADEYKAYVKYENIDYKRDEHSAVVTCQCTLYDNDGRRKVENMVLNCAADENNLNWYVIDGEGANTNDAEGAEAQNSESAGDIYEVAIQNLREGIGPDGNWGFDDFKEGVEYAIYDYDGDGKDDILVHWLTEVVNTNKYCYIYLNKSDSFSLENMISFDEALSYPTYWTPIEYII
ncbi:MAG: hypothetical protein PUC65_04920 [Clostridiales bacterium]|nr:hypothetical protein [Clostridiales bacterium]